MGLFYQPGIQLLSRVKSKEFIALFLKPLTFSHNKGRRDRGIMTVVYLYFTTFPIPDRL